MRNLTFVISTDSGQSFEIFVELCVIPDANAQILKRIDITGRQTFRTIRLHIKSPVLNTHDQISVQDRRIDNIISPQIKEPADGIQL